MPAAAQVNSSVDASKCKTISASNNAMANNDPTKIANTIIEKKIRNLEKRKTRLLEIKALEDKGQQLEEEQKNAVKKLDSVFEMIEMLKEINKSISDSLGDLAKQQKKQLKREQQEKQLERQQEWENMKSLCQIQSILSRLSLVQKIKNNVISINLESEHAESLKKLVGLSDDGDLNDYSEKINTIFDEKKISGLSNSELKELAQQMNEANYSEKFEAVLSQIKNSSSFSNETTITKDKPELNSPQIISDTDHQNSSTTFVKEPVSKVDNQKDPAVVASGFAYTASTNSPVTLPHSVLAYSTVSADTISTQTFTNQNYPAYPFQPALPSTFISPHVLMHARNLNIEDLSSSHVENNNTHQKPTDSIQVASQDTESKQVNGFGNEGKLNGVGGQNFKRNNNPHRSNIARGGTRNFGNNSSSRGRKPYFQQENSTVNNGANRPLPTNNRGQNRPRTDRGAGISRNNTNSNTFSRF